MSALQKVNEKLLILFSDNQMKLSPDKYHLLLNVREKTCIEN